MDGRRAAEGVYLRILKMRCVVYIPPGEDCSYTLPPVSGTHKLHAAASAPRPRHESPRRARPSITGSNVHSLLHRILPPQRAPALSC